MNTPSTSAAISAYARAWLWIACFMALAQPMQGHAGEEDQQLLTAIETFLYQQAQQPGDEVTIDVLPSSARLPHCENPEPFLPQTNRRRWGRVSVGVHCGTTTRNVRYLQAQISVTGNYLVIATQIPAGTVITPALLDSARGDKSKLPPNAIFSAEEVVGRLAKHQLAVGTIVQSQQLYRAPLVQSSQKIIIETRGAGFTISREAEALESGALGDRIRVRTSRQQTLNAIVIGAGRASPEL